MCSVWFEHKTSLFQDSTAHFSIILYFCELKAIIFSIRVSFLWKIFQIHKFFCLFSAKYIVLGLLIYSFYAKAFKESVRFWTLECSEMDTYFYSYIWISTSYVFGMILACF